MGCKFIEEAFNFALCQSSFVIEAGEQCVFRCKYFISYLFPTATLGLQNPSLSLDRNFNRFV